MCLKLHSLTNTSWYSTTHTHCKTTQIIVTNTHLQCRTGFFFNVNQYLWYTKKINKSGCTNQHKEHISTFINVVMSNFHSSFALITDPIFFQCVIRDVARFCCCCHGFEFLFWWVISWFNSVPRAEAEAVLIRTIMSTEYWTSNSYAFRRVMITFILTKYKGKWLLLCVCVGVCGMCVGVYVCVVGGVFL